MTPFLRVLNSPTVDYFAPQPVKKYPKVSLTTKL